MAEPLHPPADAAVRVLAAEDNPINRNVLVAILHLAGITPTMVADGAQLLKEWRRGRWDIVLTDIEMPEMDGLSAARSIRREEAERNLLRTPIVAITAHDARHAMDYEGCGFDAVVHKPIEVKPFLRTLSWIIAASPRLREERDRAEPQVERRRA